MISSRPCRVMQGESEKDMKKYRVNESEHFNLMSMYDHLKCMEIDARENNDWLVLEKSKNGLKKSKVF